VVEASPAQRAGLRPEDLILAIDGVLVAGVDDVQRLLVSDVIGATLRVRLVREGRELTIDLVPAELEA
jgi:S1-C subfamily serine protease